MIKIEDLKVGMKVKVGNQRAANDYYKKIVGEEVTITHVKNHLEDRQWRNDSRPRIYVHCVARQGGYDDRNHPTLMHLAEDGILWSWFIRLEDVLFLDNEAYLEALPEW